MYMKYASRTFVKEYSEIALAFIKLTKKDKAWDWSAQYQSTFEKLKKSMWMNLVLPIIDMIKKLEVQTDTSDFALRGVFKQKDIWSLMKAKS